jgi:hypothetical protein
VATKTGKIIADFSTSLATAMAIGATSVSLQSATDDDGNALPAGRYFFAIDGDNSQKEHISCTLSGTSLTAINSLSRQGVETSGVIRAHRVGATVTLTDWAHLKFINDLVDGTTTLDASAPLGYDGTASITTSNQLATKAYVDAVAIAGGANASSTVKGISKLTLDPVSGTNPLAVGDNDPRVPTTNQIAAMAGTSGTTPSSSNKFVDNGDTATSGANKVLRLDGSGKLPALDASAVTGSPALNASNFTNLPSIPFLTGTISGFSTSSAGNNDQTITTTFTPRLIRISYWLQGHTPSAGTNTPTAVKGAAVFNGTTLQFNNVEWKNDTAADNTAPNTGSSGLTFLISPDSASSPATGAISGTNGGIVITLSIASVSSTNFVIRLATTLNGTGATARASLSYEAFA